MIDENTSEMGKNYSILTDRQLVDCVFNIIEQSKKFCFIVSPFFDIQNWKHLTRRLKEASDNKKRILFILVKPNENSQNYQKDKENVERIIQELNGEYKFDIYFVRNLHAKIYLNENEVLITSMNLQRFSNDNNYEIGCLIKDATVVLEIVHDIIFKQILNGDSEYVEGMWSDWLKNRQFLDENIGYCISCKNPIPYNENNPLCSKCNDANGENNNFCHKCGTNYQNISINFPLCRACYDISHIKSANCT